MTALRSERPTSPMAKHAAAQAEQQLALTQSLTKRHEALGGKVDELTTAVKVQTAASQATSKTASVTPLKGITYAGNVHAQSIAAGLGDEYTNTGAVTGRITRSKRGDGLLTVADADARLVLEMTDSHRAGWNGYLDEAERNRDAGASLGLPLHPQRCPGDATAEEKVGRGAGVALEDPRAFARWRPRSTGKG